MDQQVTAEGGTCIEGAITGTALHGLVADRLAAWGRLWEVGDLGKLLQIRIRSRLQHTLGRAIPAQGCIHLSTLALTSTPLLDEVLCHEAAHIAVYLRYGAGCRPHGGEWQALMRAAGFEARTHIPIPARPLAPRPSRLTRTYEHRCPVCQSVYLARRPVSRLRCAACLAVGLDGILEITRREAR